jgi:Cu2+-containing amine oxidase
VPYHDGNPRYYDVTNFAFSLVDVSSADCPASVGGATLGSPAHVCKEVRDRWIAWKDYGNVRRGQELSLWGALGAGNYNYVMEWIFRDDGVLIGRVGATAVNLPWKPLMTHVHNPFWRLDVYLDGFQGDSVNVMTHAEAGLLGNDSHTLVATEQGIAWDVQAFTSLHIVDASLKNGQGKQSGFILMPYNAAGASRHDEAFTKFDMWVTRYKWSETEARSLPDYINPPENVANADVVLWYKGSLHHHPRDEDGEFVNGAWVGEAHLMWTGFMLMPYNFFDRTPLNPRR